MWLGEQITERGIGNGASLMIFFSIVERIWPGILDTFQFVSTQRGRSVLAGRARHRDGRRGRGDRRGDDGRSPRADSDPAAHDGARSNARGEAQLHSAAHQRVGRHADRLRAVGHRGSGRRRAVQR